MSLLDNASLLITPNAYKEGKLYSVIPTNGNGDFTFTRATTATRVNSDGLVELVPYNLIRYSEQFDNAAWNNVIGGGGLAPVRTANAAIAPDGTLTADQLFFDRGTGTTGSSISGLNQSTSPIAETCTGSIWIKAATLGDIGKQIAIRHRSTAYVVYTLTNEWVRVSSTQTGANLTFDIVNRATFTADATVTVLLWGAQLVEGSTALTYQKTETRLNIPRLDYSLGGCPNILLEPQRTNLALRSQEFDNASWVKVNASVTANTTTSPDGTSNADSLVENTATNLHLTYQFFTSTATTYTYSCYIKPDSRTRAYLRTDTSAGTTRTLFDLTGAGSVVTLAHTSATITLVGNGWYRCTITFTEGTGAANRLFAVEGAVGTSISYAGNGLTAFYLYGSQLEAGAYATSYIPTTSASVTRNQDVASKTGISSLIGQTEGTMYAEVNYKNLATTARFITISDGTNNNVVQFYRSPNSAGLRGYIAINGTAIFDNDIVAGTITINEFLKIAIAYKSGDTKIYVNGTPLISINTTYSNSIFDRLNFANQTNNNRYEGLVKSVALWKTRLTNAELAQLTTI